MPTPTQQTKSVILMETKTAPPPPPPPVAASAKEVEGYVYLLPPWTIPIIYHLCRFRCVTQRMQQDKFAQTQDQRNRKILFIRSVFIVMCKAVFL